MAKADTAMYECKRTGDGVPVFFDESMPGAEQADAWEWPAPPDE